MRDFIQRWIKLALGITFVVPVCNPDADEHSSYNGTEVDPDWSPMLFPDKFKNETKNVSPSRGAYGWMSG